MLRFAILALALVACADVPVEVETVCFHRGHVFFRQVGAVSAVMRARQAGNLRFVEMPTFETPCGLRREP